MPRGSEVELESQPEHVRRPLEVAWSVLHWVGEIAMQPEHVDLDIFIPVPVQAQFGRDGLVGPSIGVGEPGAEDLIAEAEPTDAAHDFPGARPARFTSFGGYQWP